MFSPATPEMSAAVSGSCSSRDGSSAFVKLVVAINAMHAIILKQFGIEVPFMVFDFSSRTARFSGLAPAHVVLRDTVNASSAAIAGSALTSLAGDLRCEGRGAVNVKPV